MKTPVRKILYTAPRGVGDVMFSLPLVHSLRKAYPGAQIFVPVTKDKEKVLQLVGFLEGSQRYLPKPSDDLLASQRWQASVDGDSREKYRLEKLIYEKYLDGEEYDLAIIPKNFHIGSIDCPTQVSETDLVRGGFNADGLHMVDRFARFADYLGIKKEMCFDLGFDKGADITLDSGRKVEADQPYVVLNLGASLSRKTWTPEGYAETARWCLDNDIGVVLAGDKESFDAAQEVQDLDSRVINTMLKKGHGLDLENFARLANRAHVVVSGDTGLLHLADAVGTPVIGLYGPTDPAKFAPYNNKERVVSRHDMDQNVKNIPSEEVIKRLMEVKIK